MKYSASSIVFIVAILSSSCNYVQLVKFSKDNLKPVGVSLSFEKFDYKAVVVLVKDSTIKEIDEATFAKLSDVEFSDGTIEVSVLSKLVSKAQEGARGFIGVAFRISEDNSKSECIYIRPSNGRAEDQVRRNHSIQYFGFPDFKFPRLRKESPEKYESYAWRVDFNSEIVLSW